MEDKAGWGDLMLCAGCIHDIMMIRHYALIPDGQRRRWTILIRDRLSRCSAGRSRRFLFVEDSARQFRLADMTCWNPIHSQCNLLMNSAILFDRQEMVMSFNDADACFTAKLQLQLRSRHNPPGVQASSLCDACLLSFSLETILEAPKECFLA